MAEKFSLKDFLFNEQKLRNLAGEITAVYPRFAATEFVEDVVGKFPELELKQRISWIAECLRRYLPADYRQAVQIILSALPPANDNSKTDNDFGDFIHAPYAEFVARYGCTRQDLVTSLAALREITMRFSAEDAIRYFINKYPEVTMAELESWSRDSHYHVRRLASEGTRPKLPWSQKLAIPVASTLPILENLFSDKTRYVTRSVANHINDISKIDPDLALTTLKRWRASGEQAQTEMDYITNHALRTLIKAGHKGAFALLGFSAVPQVELHDLKLKQSVVEMGQALEFSFMLSAVKSEKLIVDYTIYFQGKKANGNNKKVFKLKRIAMRPGQKLELVKRHPLRKNMTTRQLYPGVHRLEVQLNGNKVASAQFELV